MRYKIRIFISTLVVFLFGLSGVASAHVVVKPSIVQTADLQTYSVSVPTEKDIPTVGLKLTIPSGLGEVTPTVKPGWQLETTKDSNGNVTEIDWTGGSIPPEQRDDFTFSAQAPDSPTNLIWKAYQTYQDGSVVSWVAAPSGSDDAEGDTGPYSITKVMNEIPTFDNQTTTDKNNSAYALIGLTLLLSVFALTRTFKNKRN